MLVYYIFLFFVIFVSECNLIQIEHQIKKNKIEHLTCTCSTCPDSMDYKLFFSIVNVKSEENIFFSLSLFQFGYRFCHSLLVKMKIFSYRHSNDDHDDDEDDDNDGEFSN